MSFLGGHWYPCFGFLVMSLLGFTARVGSALFTFCRGKCNVHYLRSTSSATLADLLAVGAQPVLSPHTVAEVRLLGFELVLSEYLRANWAKPGPNRPLLFYIVIVQHSIDTAQFFQAWRNFLPSLLSNHPTAHLQHQNRNLAIAIWNTFS